MNTNDCVIRLEKREEYRQAENPGPGVFPERIPPRCSEHFVIHVLRDDPALSPTILTAASKNRLSNHVRLV